jgi:hypothetical protein
MIILVIIALKNKMAQYGSWQAYINILLIAYCLQYIRMTDLEYLELNLDIKNNNISSNDA